MSVYRTVCAYNVLWQCQDHAFDCVVLFAFWFISNVGRLALIHVNLVMDRARARLLVVIRHWEIIGGVPSFMIVPRLCVD